MKKYAFIVDPLSSGTLYTDEIKKFGLTPVAILSHFPILPIYAASYKEADFEYKFIHMNDEALIKELSHFLGNDTPAFIVAGAEYGVELADKLSSHFCPALSNGIELSHCRRNKFAMVERLVKCNVPTAKTFQSRSMHEILAWCEQNNLLSTGIVIKPVNSTGTDSVSACFSEEGVRTAMGKYLDKKNLFNQVNEAMLVQEFLFGTEYVVDTASFAGKHRVTNICRYTKIPANGVKFVYDRLDFLPPFGTIQQELAEYIFKVLDALGIQYGPAHSEVIYTQNGPRLVETGARPHGGIGISACRLATGTSHLDATLSHMLKKSEVNINEIRYTIQRYTRIVFLISYFDKRMLAEHENMQKLKDLPSLNFLKLLVKPGDRLQKTIDFFTLPGLLILSHEDEAQVEKDYQMVRQLEQEGLFLLTTSGTDRI